MVKLWSHEVLRIFYDRLTEEKDRDWFLNQINSMVKRKLELTWETDMLKNIIFGDYAH